MKHKAGKQRAKPPLPNPTPSPKKEPSKRKEFSAKD